MYLEHYGLAEPPFRITPHTEFFYQGANRGATLDALLYAILHDEGLVKVTGEVGSGKTMLCRVLMERLPPHIDTVYLANPSMSREEILLTLAAELKLSPQGERPHLLIRELQSALIERFAAGRQVLVLIDEAHAMPEESLEEVRLLSNLDHGHHKLLQLVLFGQPELNLKLATQSMRQLRERITHSFELAPLHQTDVGEYLMFRLRTAGYKGPDLFTPRAVGMIASESEGLTRRINILADKSLLASFANGKHQVDTVEADAAIRDSGFRVAKKQQWHTPALASVLLIFGLFAGAAVARWTQPPSNQVNANSAHPQTTDSSTKPKANGTATDAAQPAQSARIAIDTPPSHALDLRDNDPHTLFDARLDATNAAFTKAAPATYTILLSIAARTQRDSLGQLMIQTARKLPADELFLYPTETRHGVPLFGLTYGLFPNQLQAANALAKLPAELRYSHPILRTIGGIKEEQSRTKKSI